MSGVEVDYTEDGPAGAPVVVLSNSLGTDRSMWDPQVPALAERYRVITYDTRGHGRSPVPSGPYAIDDLADDLLLLLDRVGAERAHVVGLSLGGMTAMRLAAREPARVNRLVLMCTATRLDAAVYGERAQLVRKEGTGSVSAAVVGRWVTPGFAAGHPQVVADLEAMVAGTPDEGYAGCCEALAAMDLRADLARIAAPTLVIAGGEDQATPPERLREIADGISGARMITVSPAAHLANVEQPLAVTGELLGHLDAGGDAA